MHRKTPLAPLVTVAMVTYNSARYVAEAIESVLAQECEDFELLVCDDCSRDDTFEIASRYDDPRIRVLRNDFNMGEYQNRNQALRLARGKYVMFLDGDDFLYPHGLGFMVKMMESFPKAAFASAHEPNEKFIYPVELAPHEFCACAFLGPVVVGNDFTQLIFRTESLRSIGGFDCRFRSGDMHIQLALGMRENSVMINGNLAWWRHSPGQASAALHADGLGIAELVVYGREMLDDPACPLSNGEKAIARANLSRLMLRAVAKCALTGRPIHAMYLFERSGLPLAEARHLLSRFRRPFLSDVSGENPIHTALGAPAPTRLEARPIGIKVRRLAASRASERIAPQASLFQTHPQDAQPAM